MSRENEAGFSTLEFLLVAVTLAVIVVAGFFVTSHVNKKTTSAATNKAVSTPSKETTSPYVGWNSYSLQYEKVSLKYPPGWSLTNVTQNEFPNPSALEKQEIADQDQILINGPSGYTFNMETGGSFSGDGTCIASSQPITTLGQSLFLVFEGGYSAGCKTTGYAGLSMQSGSNKGYVNDKYATTSKGAVGNQMDVSITFKTQTLNSLFNDPNYQKELLILKSLSY